MAFFLPQNMELVVLVNSPVGPPDQFLYTVVSDAYTSNIVLVPPSLASRSASVSRRRPNNHSPP